MHIFKFFFLIFVPLFSQNDEIKIHTNGQVDIGTSGTLRAIINQASNNGHYFASQCDDNSNGFEI